MMKSQALLLILLMVAAAAAAADTTTSLEHTASSALRGRRRTGSVVTVSSGTDTEDDRERGDGNTASGGTNTTIDDTEDDRERGDGNTAAGATESEDEDLTMPLTSFPSPSSLTNTELIVATPEPTPSPQEQWITRMPISSTLTPSPTPDPTMPKLFPVGNDENADASTGSTEGGESFPCNVPFVGAICDIDLCAAPIVDGICEYFGFGGEEETQADDGTTTNTDASVAGDVDGGDEIPTGSPSTKPTVPPTKFPTTNAPTYKQATRQPSSTPTASPVMPSAPPTGIPITNVPTYKQATRQPSSTPTASPVMPSAPPTGFPTTDAPTYKQTTRQPSARPSASPIDAPTTSSPTNSPSDSPTSPPTEILECPVGNWDPYTIPDLESSSTAGYVFNYTQESYELSAENQIHRAYVVRDNCVYVELTSEGGETSFGRPEEWLDAAAVHYGGAPYANGAKFSGTAVPGKGAITVVRAGVSEWSVMIQAVSDSVEGDKPLTWIDMPSEQRAKDFRTFLWTILETNPQILLSNDSNRCGSGPFCATVGPDACYMDPLTGRLHVEYRMDQSNIHTADFTDAMEWFGACAATINCFPKPGGGQFLYPAQPQVAKVDEIFSFYGDDTVSGGSLEWECGHERQSYKLYLMARAAARDPRSPFAVGGSL